VKLASDGKLDGITVETVATGTNSDYPNYPPSKWLAREKWPFTPVLADDKGQHALIAAGADAYPFFVFIGKDGKVAARASGELPPDTIATVVKNLVDGKSPFAKA
jgi:hypothetical protein